jgi:hypothetical protein
MSSTVHSYKKEKRQEVEMDDSQNAFSIETNISEDLLVDLADAVDQLDNLRMVISGVVYEPESDRELEAVIERAIEYLRFLYDTIAENDLHGVSTYPLEESSTRRRIARVLRSGLGGMQ